MSLKGAPELKARLKAIRQSFKPIGKSWADETVDIMRATAPVRTGRVQGSIRRREASMRRAVVAAHYTATFPDKGAKPHRLAPKNTGRLIFTGTGPVAGRTIFSKKAVKHRGQKAQRFARRAALEARDKRHVMLHELVRQWNEAA